MTSEVTHAAPLRIAAGHDSSERRGRSSRSAHGFPPQIPDPARGRGRFRYGVDRVRKEAPRLPNEVSDIALDRMDAALGSRGRRRVGGAPATMHRYLAGGSTEGGTLPARLTRALTPSLCVVAVPCARRVCA